MTGKAQNQKPNKSMSLRLKGPNKINKGNLKKKKKKACQVFLNSLVFEGWPDSQCLSEQISRYLQTENLMIFPTLEHPKGYALVKKATVLHSSMGHIAEGAALRARSLLAYP